MNERIRELIERAAKDTVNDPNGEYPLDLMECFAELVATAEREACAKLVEEVGRQTAAAIRARREA